MARADPHEALNIVKHDPHGLIRNDMVYLRKVFPRQAYNSSTPHDEIMFAEGQQSILNFIEDNLIAKRLDILQ